MRLKKCKRCGKAFESDKQGAYMCPDCALESRRDSVLRQRECISCGATFVGYPRSKRCPECQASVEREKKKAYMKAGPKRPLGSEDACAKCGKPYIVESGSQKYCKECAAAAIKDNILVHKREYQRVYAEDEENQKYKAEMRDGNKICVVCGNVIRGRGGKITCSPECERERKRIKQNEADIRRGRCKPADQRMKHDRPKSGVVGVTWYQEKWQATYKRHYIGIFQTVEEAKNAIEAYKSKKEDEGDE